MIKVIHGEKVNGIEVDPQTRCAHYNSGLDIIAIKFKCCGQWFPCYECHNEIASHAAQVWPLTERNVHVILCGACGRRLYIAEYLDCDSTCPRCGGKFNPGCVKHHHLYFE
jgi:uncharacterized CHY-type Zn-finger protein